MTVINTTKSGLVLPDAAVSAAIQAAFEQNSQVRSHAVVATSMNSTYKFRIDDALSAASTLGEGTEVTMTSGANYWAETSATVTLSKYQSVVAPTVERVAYDEFNQPTLQAASEKVARSIDLGLHNAFLALFSSITNEQIATNSGSLSMDDLIEAEFIVAGASNGMADQFNAVVDYSAVKSLALEARKGTGGIYTLPENSKVLDGSAQRPSGHVASWHNIDIYATKGLSTSGDLTLGALFARPRADLAAFGFVSHPQGVVVKSDFDILNGFYYLQAAYLLAGVGLIRDDLAVVIKSNDS